MLKQMRYFQAVVRCGSFSRAAEECYISQSAISQQVQSLERELGVALLDRTRRRIALTPAGEYFYRQSLFLTADADRLCQETQRIARGEESTLRAGCLRGYGGTEFQKAAAEFAAAHPDITLETDSGSHEELYDLLRTGRADLIFSDQRRAFSDEYVNLLLAELDCRVEISAENPAGALEYVDVSDLRHTPCILVASKEQQKTEQAYYSEICSITGEFLFAETLDEARLMAAAGRGFLPVEGGTLPPQFADTLVCLPLYRKGKPVRHNYCAFWRADSPRNGVEDFARLLKQQF